MAAVTTTIGFTTTSTASASQHTTTVTAYATGPQSTTRASTRSGLTSTAPPGTNHGLVSLEDELEWIFGTTKVDVTFSTPSRSTVMVHVPDTVKQRWLTKDCVSATAARDGIFVDSSMTEAKGGLIIRLPRREAYGEVQIMFAANCKPSVFKVVKVYFGGGILDEAIEITKNLCHDLTELVPAAAQEAERRFGEVKGSWASSSRMIGECFGFHFAEAAHTAYEKATEVASAALSTWSEASVKAAKELTRLQDVQNELHLVVLEAQISAKIWWLKVTNRGGRSEEYRDKAKGFMASKRENAATMKAAGKLARGRPEIVVNAKEWFWSKLLGGENK